MPLHRLVMLRRFFQDYKLLEGKAVEVDEMHCTATTNTAARASKGREKIASDYIPLNTRLSSLVSLAPIVMVWLAVPSFSCQALIV